MEKELQAKLYKNTIKLAESWQYLIENSITASEKKEQDKYKLLAVDKISKNVLGAIFDQIFRIESSSLLSAQLIKIFKKYGVPGFFNAIEKFLIKLFVLIGHKFPFISIPLVKRQIKKSTKKVIISDKALPNTIKKNSNLGITSNLNHLGEAVLGDSESLHHLQEYLKLLDEPLVDYISIKISNLSATPHPLGIEESKQLLKERLSQIFSKVQLLPVKPQSSYKHKFINLDMEDYKFLDLTLEVFMETLDEDDFKNISAGIVLQAYIPDSYSRQIKLINWAKKRVKEGGAPVKMRLVKGANMETEAVSASLLGLPSPVLPSKVLADANYKKMLDLAVRPESIKYVRLGVASHNLFDLAYAYVLAEHYAVKEHLDIELLNGIADPLVRSLIKSGLRPVIYTPFASKQNFLNAVGYLVRRLDENTSKENYLTNSFGMSLDSPNWEYLKLQFLEAQALKHTVSKDSIYFQDRSLAVDKNSDSSQDTFKNEVETDFYLATNQKWAHHIKDEFKKSLPGEFQTLLAQVGSKFLKTGHYIEFYDFNHFPKVPLYKFYTVSKPEIDQIITAAEESSVGWSSLGLAKRWEYLKKVANLFRINRASLIGVMAQNTAKVFIESDGELNEAIDFLEYYPYSLNKLTESTGASFNGKGAMLVISPWNFPLAIPVGGVAANLAAGNSVILKAASDSAVIAYKFAELFWQAGVPKEVFQVLITKSRDDLDYLVSHSSIKHIVFTGSNDVIKKIITNNYKVPVSAETGGKNSTIITNLADIDLAIKNVVHSAFSNAGQKCSCTSLLILEEALYYSKRFRDKLLDCAKSYVTGPAWELSNYYGPLIKPPKDKLLQAITTLDGKEEWLLKPLPDPNNPYILSPGIKFGVEKGSFMHQTELFGPVLGVMCAKSLVDAVDIANDTNYGLTAGLESLDKQEQEYWLANIQAGNLYINRNTVGAIVNRQAFGGIKGSCFGLGFKAGGSNYAAQFTNVTEDNNATKHLEEKLATKFEDDYYHLNGLQDFEELFKNILPSFVSYQYWFQKYFSRTIETDNILGQYNALRYLRNMKVIARAKSNDSFDNLLKICLAGVICGSDLFVSYEQEFGTQNKYNFELLKNFSCHFKFALKPETESVFAKSMLSSQRIRYLSPQSIEDKDLQSSSRNFLPVISHSPYDNGRLELPYYLQEQSISYTFHRYGNLGIMDFHGFSNRAT